MTHLQLAMLQNVTYTGADPLLFRTDFWLGPTFFMELFFFVEI